MATTLGDPIGMRPSTQREWDGRLGEHQLDDGSLVWAVWLPTSRTHTHIIIWDGDGILATEENVVRAGAARRTEQMFQELEV